jgi:hypothetical protein
MTHGVALATSGAVQYVHSSRLKTCLAFGNVGTKAPSRAVVCQPTWSMWMCVREDDVDVLDLDARFGEHIREASVWHAGAILRADPGIDEHRLAARAHDEARDRQR